MRVVVQRCSRAEVRIEGDVVGQIAKGFVLLVGITEGDTQSEAEYLAKKVAQMRVFEDAEGKMNLGLKEVDGAILSISQFTLYADCRKGRRPSFNLAKGGAEAEELYKKFVAICEQKLGKKVETGIFGADMAVSLVNDGPFTIIYDSDEMV